MLKEGKKEKIIGLAILVVVIVLVVIIKGVVDYSSGKNLTIVYGAVGGGKEDFMDREITSWKPSSGCAGSWAA